MKRTAIYAGTFNPFHNGHLAVVARASQLFDELIIGVGQNPEKENLSDTLHWDILQATKYLKTVSVSPFTGLLVDFAKQCKAQYLVRGLRAVSDFEYEFQMSIMNKKLAPDINTIFIMAPLSYMWLSSSIIRGVLQAGGDIKDLVPEPIFESLMEKLEQKKVATPQIIYHHKEV